MEKRDCLLFQAEDDPEDDGGPDDGGDDIDGNDARLARHRAYQITDEGQRGTRKQSGGQEHAMVGTAQKEAGNVGNRQADEGDGAAKGGGRGGEETGGKEQEGARAADADTEITSVVVAQKQGIEGFDEQHRERQPHKADGDEPRQAVERDAGESTHAPKCHGMDALGCGAEVEQRDDAASDVTYHHARNKEHDIVVQNPAQEEQDGHDGESPEQGGGDDEGEASERELPRGQGTACGQDDKGHSEVGSAVDS